MAVINGRGIHAGKEQIRVLSQAPRPSAKELHSLLGFAQYYAKFVPGFAQIARPLFETLTAKDLWTVDEFNTRGVGYPF